MALHRAEQVTAAFESFITGLSTTGSNIDRDRAYAWDASISSALSLYQGVDEPFNPDTQNYHFVDHRLTLRIDIHVRRASVTPLSQALNAIRKEIALALQASSNLGLNFVIDIIEGPALEPVIDASGDKPTAIQAYNWYILYRRSRTDPSA